MGWAVVPAIFLPGLGCYLVFRLVTGAEHHHPGRQLVQSYSRAPVSLPAGTSSLWLDLGEKLNHAGGDCGASSCILGLLAVPRPRWITRRKKDQVSRCTCAPSWRPMSRGAGNPIIGWPIACGRLQVVAPAGLRGLGYIPLRSGSLSVERQARW